MWKFNGELLCNTEGYGVFFLISKGLYVVCRWKEFDFFEPLKGVQIKAHSIAEIVIFNDVYDYI